MPYVTVDELVAILGPGADRARLAVAADAITEFIDRRTGRSWGSSDPFAGPLPASVHQLALIGALRYYHDPEAPYGVVQGGEGIPMYMRSLMTDADALLLGLHADAGFA